MATPPVQPLLSSSGVLADLTSACGADPGAICELVHGWTDSDLAAKAAVWAVQKPVSIATVLAVAWFVARLAHRFIERTVSEIIERGEADRQRTVEANATASSDRSVLSMQASERAHQRAITLKSVLKSATNVVIWTLAGLIALGELGINLGPLIAGAGIAGIAIGFGAQSLVRDFLAGVFIIIEDQYGVGDVVDVGPATGVIEAVSMRATRLRDVEGVLWVVPNGEISRVGNMSQLWSRTVLDIDVAYDTDLDHAMRIMKDVAVELWQAEQQDATVIEEPEVVGVQALGDSAISIRLMVKTDPSEQWNVARALRKAIKERFDAEGIEIPFPQSTVHLRTPKPTEP